MIIKKKFSIEGLDCANCASKLEKSINALEGVEKATISFFTEKLSLEAEEDSFDRILGEINTLASKYNAKVTK